MADITNLNSTAIPKTVPGSADEDPKIIRLAKLVLILADKDTDLVDRLMCLKLGIRMGFLTEEEAVTLWANRSELEEFMTNPEDK